MRATWLEQSLAATSSKTPNGSKSATSSSNAPNSAPSFPDFLAQNSLTSLLAPAAPTFPTFFELTTEATPPPQQSAQSELFPALVPDVRRFFKAVLNDPSIYEDGVVELAQELLQGKKFEELDKQDRDKLNRAVFDLTSPKKRQPPEPKPSSITAAPSDVPDSEDETISPPDDDNAWWKNISL